MEEQRFACGCPGCPVWFTSEETRAAHHAAAHTPEDVALANPPPDAPAPDEE